ncbi:MAG: phosphopyruvate hydratase, partial [Proteobacteria bacterium]|nr:phosphopyruvate hydratase [Pseudomonadota bacterium]
YHGKSVTKAIKNIEQTIVPKILNFKLSQQREFDEILKKLDGSPNKSKLGANAILACSMAYAKLSASSQNLALFEYFDIDAQNFMMPIPMMNLINGGAHADSGLSIQEFMIMPLGLQTTAEQIRVGSEIFHTLKKLLKNAGYKVSVGDEGGFAPNLESNEHALDFLVQAINESGYTPGVDVYICLDVAASEFYSDGVYKMMVDNQMQEFSSSQLVDYFAKMCEDYPIFSIEDPMDESDTQGWIEFMQKLGDKIQVVGDDYLVTNPDLIADAIENNSCNAVLIKPNQIGTITETVDAINLAKNNAWNTVVSHRSGDSEDSLIADLAVGMQTGQIKTGSLCRSERTCKYNRFVSFNILIVSLVYLHQDTLLLQYHVHVKFFAIASFLNKSLHHKQKLIL